MQYYLDQVWEMLEAGRPLSGIPELARNFPHLSAKILRDGAETGKIPAIKMGSRWFSTKKVLTDFWRDENNTQKRGVKKPKASVRLAEADGALSFLGSLGMKL